MNASTIAKTFTLVLAVLGSIAFLATRCGTTNPTNTRGLYINGAIPNTFVGEVVADPAVSTNGVVILQQLNDATNMMATDLASTNAGSEGVAQIGAFGGYKLDEFLEDNSLRGPARDLPIFRYNTFPATNLVVTYSRGDVYDPYTGYHHLASGTFTLVDNAVNYAYWASNSMNTVQWTTGTRPSAETSIYLGTFTTSFGYLLAVDTTYPAGDNTLYHDVAFASMIPSYIVSGLNAYATSTNLNSVVMNSGLEFHNMTTPVNHAQTSLSAGGKLAWFGHTNSIWAYGKTNLFPVGLYDNSTNIVPCAASNWYRGLFVDVANSGYVMWVMPDNVYTSYNEVVLGVDPDLPPGFVPYVAISTAYIFQGSDTIMRTSSSYWPDRRRYLPFGPVTTAAGGGNVTVNTPTIGQTLQAGSGTGGILPSGMGFPTTSDQAASKGYVDSTVDNINSGKAYVDPKGNDATAMLGSSILPYQHIQTAINAAAAVSTKTNRWATMISPGIYNESLTMRNAVNVEGVSVEATIINGTVTFPPSYKDTTCTQIGSITINATNAYPLIVDAGADNAFAGIRNCILISTYDNYGATNESVGLMQRGICNVYPGCVEQLNVGTNNGIKHRMQIFEHSTDPANPGLSTLNAIGNTFTLHNDDINADVSQVMTHDNTDAACINSILGTTFDVVMTNMAVGVYSNMIKLVSHNEAIGRTLSMGCVTRLYLTSNNQCNVMHGWADQGSGLNVAISRNNHVRFCSGATTNIWMGAATTTNDSVRVLDSEYIVDNIGNLGYEPLRWTNNGTAGNYWINTPLQNGDHVFGSSILMGAVNTPAVAIPIGQQMRLFCDISANIVNPAFMDSFGNLVRLGRDSDFNVYNAESTTLQMGEVISIYTNITSTLHWVKRAIATNLNTAADGVVVHNGGIPAGSAGRIMRLGRTELPTYINTSYCTPGQNLYLSSTVAGGFTNVSPYVDPNAAPGAFSQPIGKVNMIGVTNGQMTVLLSGKPDILGGLLPSAYAKYANPAFSVDAFKLTNSATAQFSLSGVAAGTTNTYVLPVSGGLLASYTDIQLVPVSVSVGEIGGVGIGRAVYQSGSVSGRPQVRYADRSDSTKLPVIGITMSAGNFGDVIQVANFGPLSGVDTSSFATNDLIYLGTNGFMSGQSAVSTDFEYLLGTCLIPGVSGSMLVNMHSYIEDGAFSGSMRFTIKNGSTATNATANVYVLNNAGDAMRIGIRGTNSFRGQAAYVVSSANGPTYYAAAHKKSHIFDIDMTDSGNDYVHLSWPMMALVPQNSVYSNAFLGIGTTNPLAMLHVMGSGIFSNSMTAYQSFRGKTGAYGSAELATYDDVTNLVTITSNALYSADTNLAQRITTETNRAIQAETGLQSQINNNSNLTTVASTNLLGMINAYSNALYSADTNLAQRITTETNRAIQAEVVLNTQGTNTQAQLTTETNRAIQAEAVIQGQVTTLQGSTSIWNKASSDAISATNGVAILNASTTTWNTAGITATWASNGVNSVSNRANALEGQTSVWNKAASDGISATNGVAIHNASTSLWNKASSDAVSATNGVAIIQTSTTTWNTAGVTATWASNGVNLASNRLNGLEGQTSIWNAAYVSSTNNSVIATNALALAQRSSSKFKANIGNANVSLATGLIPYTNSILTVGGGVYSNATSKWMPYATNGVIQFDSVIEFSGIAAGQTLTVNVYKNGSYYASPLIWGVGTVAGANNIVPLATQAFNWTYIDTVTPATTDFWQVYCVMSSTETTVSAGTNNWWFGQVIQ